VAPGCPAVAARAGAGGGEARHRGLDARVLHALGVEVGDPTGRIGERPLERLVGEGFGGEVGDLLGAPALVGVIGVRVEHLVLLVPADALVLALHVVHEVAEGPPGVVLERVAGGVERVAAGAGADGGDEIDHDVGLEPAALRRDLELEQAAEPDTAAISGRYGGSRGSTPQGEDAVGGHDAGAPAVDEAGQGEADAKTRRAHHCTAGSDG